MGYQRSLSNLYKVTQILRCTLQILCYLSHNKSFAIFFSATWFLSIAPSAPLSIHSNNYSWNTLEIEDSLPLNKTKLNISVLEVTSLKRYCREHWSKKVEFNELFRCLRYFIIAENTVPSYEKSKCHILGGWMRRLMFLPIRVQQLLSTSSLCKLFWGCGGSISSITPVPQPKILLLSLIASALFGSAWRFIKAERNCGDLSLNFHCNYISTHVGSCQPYNSARYCIR